MRRRIASMLVCSAMVSSLGLLVGIPNAPTVQASHTLDLVSVVPARLLETRVGPNEKTIDHLFEGIGKRPADSVVELTIAGRGGVPADATAVFLNLTAVDTGGYGFLTAYPCGSPLPATSNVNYGPGDVAPNAVLAKIGDGGKVCIYTLASTHIIADVNGYVPKNGTPISVVPARILETRQGPNDKTDDGLFQGLGKRGAGTTVELKVAGRGGVPADADAVFLNVTAVDTGGFGFLTAYPCGAALPTTSNVNYGPGEIAPNAVLAKIGADGKVCIYTLAPTDIIADVNGYVPKGGTPGTVVPSRILETRVGPNEKTIDGLFEGIGKRGAGTTVELTVAGRGGVPDDADAVFLNVTAIAPDGLGFITVYPCGVTRPQTSNINYGPGDVAPNSVLAKIGTDGKVCIYTLAAAHIVVDVSGHVPVAVNKGLTAVSFGSNHGCALDEEGAVTCWGVHTSGELGIGDTSIFAPSNSAFPQRIPNLTGVTDVDVGVSFSCAVLADATAACWGINNNGQIGDGTTADRLVPTAVSGLTGVTQITAGRRHACAIASGVVKCWGDNPNGQLGDGSTTDRLAPVTVTGLPDGKTPVSIDAGFFHTCVAFSDGTASCWGGNSTGYLGNGTLVTSHTPVTVSGLVGAVEIDVGQTVSCARLGDGTVQCWGSENRIGNGEGAGSHSTPVAVAGLSGVTAIDVGFGNACVVLSDGQGRCWGGDAFGENADGSAGDNLAPVAMTGQAAGIVAVAASDGGNTTCAVLADTTAVCWGYNFNKELGGDTGDRAPSVTPIVVGS